MATAELIQGSDEWLQARMGHVTASCFGQVVDSKGKSRTGQMPESYLNLLIGELITQKPYTEFESYAMKRGTDLEPQAREAYQWEAGVEVVEVGFIKHPSEPWIGGSPDGLVGEEGIVEIKCPENYSKHVAVLRTGEMPAEHTAQVQGNLWITGRDWCDFISYDDRFPDEAQLAVVRVERDEKYIEAMAASVVKFRDKMLATAKEICNRKRGE